MPLRAKGLALTGEQAGEEGQGEKAAPLITHPNTRLAEFVEKIAILFITHFKISTFIENNFASSPFIDLPICPQLTYNVHSFLQTGGYIVVHDQKLTFFNF